jgi:transporter family-2 protein
MWASTSWVHISAFAASMSLWFFTGKEALFSVFDVSQKLYLSGGVIGAFITYTVIKGISDLGPTQATMLILLAQLIVAYLIEVFGLFGAEKISFDWIKLIGVALMVSGIIVFCRR